MNENDITITQRVQADMFVAYCQNLHKFSEEDKKYLQAIMNDQAKQAKQAIDNLKKILEL